MRQLVVVLLCASQALAAQPEREAAALRVIVIDGAEAANIVAEKIAAEPVVEVRDKDNRRAVGAVVRFVIRKTARDRVAAVFHSGDTEVRLTDAAGQARATALTPLEPGSFEIEVQVSHQGQTATTTLRHTNYPTVAEARAAGRQPGQSSGQTAGSTAGSTARATAGAAATVPGVAAGGGVGLGKLAVIGLAVGGAAAGTAVALSQRSDGTPDARVTAVAAVRSGIQAATAFSFSVQATGFATGSLTYQWEFGDGATSSEPTPTHVYPVAGVYTVVASVSDAQRSVRSETSVIVHTVTGRWVGSSPTLAGVFTLELTHQSNAIAGLSSRPSVDSVTGLPGPMFSQCPVSGSATSGPPTIVLFQPTCINGPSVLLPGEWRLELSADGQNLTGLINDFRQVTLRRQ